MSFLWKLLRIFRICMRLRSRKSPLHSDFQPTTHLSQPLEYKELDNICSMDKPLSLFFPAFNQIETALSYFFQKVLADSNRLEYIPRKTAIHSTLITTYGLTHNEYSSDFISVVTLEDLSAE